VSAALFLASLVLAAPARAPTAVVLEGPRCALGWIDYPSILRMLGVELASERAELIAAEREPSPAAARISFEATSCAADSRALSVSFRSAAPPRTSSVAIDLKDVAPEARPRVAALAIVEHLRELLAGDAPAVSNAPAIEARRPGEEPRRDLAIWAAGAARFVPRFSALFAGATAGARLAIGASLTLLADGAFLRSGVDHPLGRVAVGCAMGGVALLYGRGGESPLAIGPRLEAGWAWTSGTASSASLALASSGGAFEAFAGLEAIVGSTVVDRLGWFAAIEGGIAIRALEARADGSAITGTSGPFAALTIGLSVSL
jgi:hypothetical protein